MGSLDNRVAIVTGGSGALGRAVTATLIKEGARVAVPYIVDGEVPLLEQAVGSGKAQLLITKADVGVESEVSRLIKQVEERMGQIHILINLVGGFWGGVSVAETKLADWQAMFDVNLKPTFLCCRAVIPAMRKNKWGRIVSVTSRTGLTGAGDFAAYAVAKGAVATFTISLAEELLGDDILVNAIAPSTIDTEANRKAMPNAKHERWVKPENIARTIAYLCSDSCSVTSGSIVPVYGRA